MTSSSEKIEEGNCGFFCKMWKFFVKIINFLTFGLVGFRSSPSPRRLSEVLEESLQMDIGNLVASAPTPLHQEIQDLALFCSATVLDGGTNFENSLNDILTIRAPGVIIQNIRFRHGQVVFEDASDGGIIQNSCFFPSSGNFGMLRTSSGTRNSLTITSNTFFNGSGRSVDIDCDNCMVSFNTLVPCLNGINVRGDDSTIHANVLKACDDNSIEVDGNNLVVTDNHLDGGQDCIDVGGDNPTVVGNTAIGCADEGITVRCELSCTGGRISSNHVEGSTDSDEGIFVLGANNFVIEDNTVMFSTNEGILLIGDNSIIRRNYVSFTSSRNKDPGFSIAGSNNLIADNVAQFVLAGIIVEAQNNGLGDASSNNVCRNNTVNVASLGGIILQSGDNHTVEENTLKDIQGDALAITSGSGHVIRNNGLIDNKLDLCVEIGAFADVTDQAISTFSDQCGQF